MPELPEVETTKNGISPYLEGAIIEKIVVRQPKLRWMVSEELAQITQQKSHRIKSPCEVFNYPT
ncbi:formamidopyrimidine-DNA glycosylase [Haemophilus influenzae 22.1-21]|nr:formamidopyrimidine-DNA glycosylase [Haemophilus influenzae 22.1-21]